MSVERIAVTDSVRLSRISRPRSVDDYSPIMIARDRDLPQANFLRPLAGADGISELRAMAELMIREVDLSFRLCLGIGRTLVPGVLRGEVIRPTHFVTELSFTLKSGSNNANTFAGLYTARICGPVFIHDLHHIIGSRYIAETSPTSNTDAHDCEKISIGVEMMRQHLSTMPRDCHMTVIAMPMRKTGECVYDITDWDASITHQMMLGVAFDSDAVWYRTLRVSDTEYGLYYFRNANNAQSNETGFDIYSSDEHLLFFEQILATWNEVNFPREISKVPLDQKELNRLHIAQMVQETVEGYRRVFRDIDARY